MTTNIALEAYRNLADWPDEEWRRLDIFRFIAANWARYGTLVTRRIGRGCLPRDIYDWLPGIFADVAYAPLRNVHARHLDATGERRNQCMLGTLKAIAATRVTEAIVEEFPIHTSIEDLPEVNEALMIRDAEDFGEDIRHPAFVWDLPDLPEDEPYDASVVRVEWLRPHLTPAQYRILHMLTCEGLDFADIADAIGCSQSNVRIMMLQARQRLLALLPDDDALALEDYRLRKGGRRRAS